MFNLESHIKIGDFLFNWVVNIEVESTWKQLTETSTVVLPANLTLDHNKLSELIKHGDEINLRFGYENHTSELFVGYVTEVVPSVPIQIKCENEMWNLKQSHITDSGNATSLKDLIRKHYSDYSFNLVDVDIAHYHIDKSRAGVLKDLKKEYGLYSFFRNDTLTIGKQYDPETAKSHTFQLDYNIAESNLKFRTKEQMKIQVTAISNLSNGSKIKIQLGDENGERRTLNFYNLSEAELKKAATREMERLVYDGWTGSFTAFGIPIVRHGDIVELIHATESDKVGKYWVDKVVYRFGVNGFRQEITLGPRT